MSDVGEVAAKFAEASRAGKVRRYKKFGQTDIRPAVPGEEVVTMVDGVRETANKAGPGDYVARGVKGECWIISAKNVASRYGAPFTEADAEGYRSYPAKGEFHAFRYEGAPFKFIAPWKEEMIANPGDYIGTNVMGSGEFYRIEKNAFAATYAEAKD
jgi:hypothetical protein